MIRLIMFDLDGTLVDSGSDITNALNYAIGPCGLGSLTVDQTKGLVGEGITSLIGKVMRDSDKDLAADVLQRFVDFYEAHLTESTRPYPGVTSTIESLAHYKKAVVSNKLESMSVRILEDLALIRHFDAVLGSDSLAEKKPSPVPLLHLMDLFSVRPDECVMVGDSAFDVEAGKRAGALTVSVTYGFRPPDTLKGADFLIDSMEELLPIIERLDS